MFITKKKYDADILSLEGIITTKSTIKRSAIMGKCNAMLLQKRKI